MPALSPLTSSYFFILGPSLPGSLAPAFISLCCPLKTVLSTQSSQQYIYILSNCFISQFIFCLHQAHFFASSLSPPNPSHKHLCLFPALLEPSIALQMQEQIKKGGGGGCCFSGIFLACLGAGAGISVSISTRQVAAGKLLL